MLAGIKNGRRGGERERKADAWWWWLLLKCIRPRLVNSRYKWDISMLRVASTGTRIG